MTLAARHPVVAAARDPSRSQVAPTLTTQPLKPHNVIKGWDTSSLTSQDNPTEPAAFRQPPSVPGLVPTSTEMPTRMTALESGPSPASHPLSVLHASTLNVTSTGHAPSCCVEAMDIDKPQVVAPTGPKPPSIHETAMALVSQRVTANFEKTRSWSKQASPKPRKPRCCAKCGIVTCPGQQIRFNCGRPCQDCGQHECIGWNTKWPEKNCQTGWANCEETKPRGIFKFQV